MPGKPKLEVSSLSKHSHTRNNLKKYVMTLSLLTFGIISLYIN